MKKFEEILEERKAGVATENALVKVELDDSALVKVTDVSEALALADSFMPVFNKKILTSEVGLTAETKEKWLATIDETLHAMEIVPKRRTMTAKRLAVLQSNRFPTAGAKFHQAVLESSVYAGQLIDETFAYEKSKIELEKKFYKYQKKMKKLKEMEEEGKDTFILEKNIELLRIELTKEIMSLKNVEKGLDNKRAELIEWSKLKEELYDEAQRNKEFWSPDEQDGIAGFEEVPLVLRHLQNFIILKTQPKDSSGGDISSVLNIEGLVLTAIQDGAKNGKLGIYFNHLSDAHISLVWQHVYGEAISVNRTEDMMILVTERGQAFQFPLTYQKWQELQDLRNSKA